MVCVKEVYNMAHLMVSEALAVSAIGEEMENVRIFRLIYYYILFNVHA